MAFTTTLPDGTVLSGIPDGTTQSEILLKYGAMKKGEAIGASSGSAQALDSQVQQDQAEPPKSEMGEFTKGVVRGGKELLTNATEEMPAYFKSVSNKALGSNFDYQQNIKEANKQNQETEQQYAAKVPTYKDIHSPGDVVDYIAGNLGEQVPNLAIGLGAGTAAGTLAGKISQNIAKETGVILSDAEVQSAMKKGAAIGIGATMLPQNVSSNYVDYMNKGKDAPFTATMVGAAQTGIQMWNELGILGKPMGMMNNLLGKEFAPSVIAKSVFNKLGVDVGDKALPYIANTVEGAATFGAANVGSSAIGMLGDHFVDGHSDLFSKQNMNTLIDQGLKGIVAGGALGAAMTPLEGKAKPDYVTDKSKVDYKPLYSNMQPTYVADNVLKAAQDHGLNTDSLMALHPAQIDETMTAMQQVMAPKPPAMFMAGDNNQHIINPALAAQAERNKKAAPQINPKELQEMLERQQSDKPKDYVPGDGVIHAGATLRDDDIIGHPAQKVKVDDPDQLEAMLQGGKQKSPLEEMGLYSKLGRMIDDKMPNNLTPDGVRQVLNSWSKQGLFKNEELEYSGIDKYLADKDPNEKISKAELIEGLQGPKVRYISGQETGHSDWPIDQLTNTGIKDSYTLEGKNTKGYREEGLRIHPDKPFFDENKSGGPEHGFWGSHAFPDMGNVLVHWRSSLKNIADKPTRFIEEIQSDWHQEGHENGYKKGKILSSGEQIDLEREWEKYHNKIKSDLADDVNSGDYHGGWLQEIQAYDHSLTDADRANGASWQKKFAEDKPYIASHTWDNIQTWLDLGHKLAEHQYVVPDAPFKKTWSQLALKRILHQAANDGLEQIALPKKEAVAEIQNHSDHRAGEFYEKRLVNELNDLGKKYGFKVEDSQVRVPYSFKPNTSFGSSTKAYQIPFKEEIFAKAIKTIKDTPRNSRGEIFRKDIANHIDNTIGSAADLHPWSIARDIIQRHENQSIPIQEAAKRVYDDYKNGKAYPTSLVKLSPEARSKILGEGFPLFQKGSEVKQTGKLEGNLFHDGIVTTEIAKNLKGIPLTDKAREELKPLIGGFHDILSQVFGHNRPELEIFSHLSEDGDFSKDPVLGAQLLNTIHLALNDSTRLSSPETFYHESFHMLMQRGVFKPQELKLMMDDIPRLKSYYDRDEHLSSQDFQRYLDIKDGHGNNIGREEVLANMIGKMAKDVMDNRNNLSKIPNGPIKQAFLKFKNFLEKVANYLKGNGFNSMDDIVKGIMDGEHGARTEDHASREYLQKADPRISDMVHDLVFARLQKNAKYRRDMDNLDGLQNFKHSVEEATREFNNLRETGSMKRMGLWGRWIRSMYNEGILDPSMLSGLIVNSTVRRMDHAQRMMSEVGEASHPFTNLDKELRYRICEIADTLNQKGLKAYVGKDGTLAYKDKTGQEYRITVGTDKDQKKIALGYMSLQEGFKKQREHYLQAVKDFAYDHEIGGRKLGMLIHPDTSFGIDHVKEAMKTVGDLGIDEETQPANREAYKKLMALRDQMEAIDEMGKSDYIPNTRFGKFGYAVRDTTDKTKDEPEGRLCYFPVIEQGAYNDTYNQKQHKAVMDDLKRVRSVEELKKLGISSDKPMALNEKRFLVEGKGQIKNFDHTTDKPFKMNYAAKSKGLDKRFINIESLSGLLASHSIDPMAWNNIRTQLSDDILKAQFSHKFERKLGIGGYSRDWDRVVNGHITGSAHFLSGLYHQRELGILSNSINEATTDERWQDKARNFLDYVNTPQEDLQRLRTMNMLWVMGGNVGTALTVAMTLPTTTLGQLAKYDPNFLKNGQLMGKWFKLSHQILASTNPREAIKALVDTGKIHEKDGKAFVKFMEIGKIRSEVMSESVGALKQDALSNASRYLGAPVAYMEKMVRAATLMAAHESIRTNPDARARAERVLERDGNFQASRLMDKSKTFEEAVALNVMDKSHGVYGKIGRPDAFKGLGGSLFMPFQTFPYYALSGLAHMLGEGKEGKIAFATTIGALMFFCGVQGLPGIEPLEDLYETVTKNLGDEKNGELMILEKIYGMTHDWKAAEFVTHGFGRTFMGLDGSKRWGFPVVGYDMLKAVTGMGGTKPSSVMGVEGTILQGFGNMWNEYNNGGGIMNALKAMAPYGVSNSLKALSYATEGVWSNPNAQGMKSQLIPKEQVSGWTIFTRMLGLTSSQLAEAREAAFYHKIINTEYTGLYDRYKARMALLQTQLVEASRDGKGDKVRGLNSQVGELSREFAKDLQHYGTTAPMGAINSVIKKKVIENITGEKPYSKNPSQAKKQYDLRQAEKDE